MKSPKTLFREYFRSRIVAGGRKLTGEALEDFIAECSEEWENSPCAEYGGKTPREYFSSLGADELIELLVSDIAEGGEPLAVITDRLGGMPEAAAALTDLVDSPEAAEDARIAAADLLWSAGRVPVENFVDLVLSGEAPEAVRERLIEILSESGAAVYDALVGRLDELTGENALIAGELLVASGVIADGITDYLLRLTEDERALPRALQLIAAYGDFRALGRLKELARTCDYATYTDIRSAVEEIGGDMDVERDWSKDATYKKIKGESK